MSFTESLYESTVIQLLTNMDYAPDLNRADCTSPLLDSVLLDSLVRLNKDLPQRPSGIFTKTTNWWP